MMGRGSNINKDFFASIKEAIEKQINEEFTQYKIMCLDNLEYAIECKRNDVVKQILDTINISMSDEDINCFEPTIKIQIVRTPKRSEN